ncbi:MAG: glycosyltransferase family 2 protein [Candidatus Dojkabacteria bacterium]|jgi:glycosyltransferase involved in cell wall biosynthesis|nr:glycosyltransferase family 2 protein [Candidatus Dojkabacteria bacterium]MDD4561399.1 glycosyltransferase family 2 protein [Candidatus Dojkabacteria bacterium]
MNKSDVYITIPMYNDEKMITKVIKDLNSKGYNNVVVVDDGSKDNGYSVVKKNTKAIVTKHIVNRGQGAALQTGMEIAIDRGAKYIVHFDSDGQHDVKDLDHMLKTLIEGKYDIVLGSRFLQENKIPLKKRIVLKGGIVFTYILSGIWLTDVHNGLRVMTAETAKKLNLQHDRMEHASEILDKVKSLNLKYKEVPVTIHYTDYSQAKGQSISNSINIAIKLISSKLRE